jgi:hypothetical protein
MTSPTDAVEDFPLLFYDLMAYIGDYVAMSADELQAVTLWTGHTWVAEHFQSTPRLAVISPEKRSGKTRLLEVLRLVCRNAFLIVTPSSASVFRRIEAVKPLPTLLIDECDIYFDLRTTTYEDMRTLIRSGYRKNAVVPRCVGDPKNFTVKDFPAFCPLSFAGIGNVPDTMLDRAVLLAMQRRRPGDNVRPFQDDEAEPPADELRLRLAEWADLASVALRRSKPALPAALVDRSADLWRPLIAIADVVGGEWPEWARSAALVLEERRGDATISLGVRLLTDIRTVLDGTDFEPPVDAVDKLSTVGLLERLHKMDEAPWASLRGKPIDARRLANLLRQYGVRSKTVWIGTETISLKGDERADFEDPWNRYVPLP